MAMRRRYDFEVVRVRDSNDPEFRRAWDDFVANRPDGILGSGNDPNRPRPPVTDKWRVTLPHQCDEWEITGLTEPYEPHGVAHERAVLELEQFIAEAQVALKHLRARKEVRDGKVLLLGV